MAAPVTELMQKTTTLVKPLKPTPSETLSFSTIDNDPYNEVMNKAIYVYKENSAMITPNDPVPIIKEALSEVLSYYYPLAGKLKRRSTDGKLQLDCTAEGVPFIVAEADRKLSSVDYFREVDNETALKLTPDFDVNREKDVGYHPLALQVTKFSCGGFVVGIAVAHPLVDGFGVAQFFQALAELASGKSEPKVKPVWKRELLVGKQDDRPPEIPGSDMGDFAASPYLPTDETVPVVASVRADSIRRLKKGLMKEYSVNEDFTTVEVLGAYVWRSRSRAMKLNHDGTTVFGLSMVIQGFLDSPLPEGYYGNTFLDMYVASNVKELDERPVSETARLIKKAKKTASDEEYIWSELGNMEKLRELGVLFDGRKDGMMFLTDWRNLGFLEMADFGWGDAVNIVPFVAPENADNVCVFLRPSKSDLATEAGVRVMLRLPKAAVPAFREEMDALNKLPASL